MTYAGTSAVGELWAKCKAAFATKVHTHAIADTSGLQTALDGKAASTHAHDFSQVDTFGSEAVYPTFTRATWSTSSDESALPVTPCFVMTPGGELYWCTGS